MKVYRLTWSYGEVRDYPADTFTLEELQELQEKIKRLVNGPFTPQFEAQITLVEKVQIKTKMKWHVKLPKGKCLWLESDTPHETLKNLGYDEYALTDFRIIPKRELPRKIKWITA